jgi:hypothetical protein
MFDVIFFLDATRPEALLLCASGTHDTFLGYFLKQALESSIRSRSRDHTAEV